ncbi:MAG: hypothetical protein IT317_20125 [Anaerolineales bacterium]|nr:hypothetical protein [Anaerolineales bacterium]
MHPYYMALSGEGAEAVRIYADLIGQALNQQKVAPSELPGWFHSGELAPTYFTPAFTLEVSPVAISGHAAGYLIALGFLHDIDTPGSACLLAVQDQDDYAIYQLHDGFAGAGFFATLRNPSECFVKDVTDDGNAEIIVNQYSGGHVGTTEITVLDITQLPHVVMPFNPARDRSLAIWNGWISSYPTVEGTTQLEIGVALGLYCEEYGLSRYQWNGQWFEMTGGQLVFGEGFAGGDEALPDCLKGISDYVRDLGALDAAAALQMAYSAYAPTVKSQRELLDELRVRQGLYSAYAGEFEAARAVFNEIVQAPAASNSAWIRPAQDFLLAFEAPTDLLSACLKVTACEYEVALPATVAIAYANAPLAQFTGELRTAGVQIPSEGWFDFDADGRDERWFDTILPSAAEPELWIAATYGSVTKALLVGPRPVLDSSFVYINDDQPEILTDLGNGQALELGHHPLTGEPFAVVRTSKSPNPIIETLERFRALREQLIHGSAPAPIYEQLLEIDQLSTGCPFEVTETSGTVVAYYDCAAYRYTLALAAELAGKEREALAFYRAVLSDYPDSAFAELARARLGL